MYSASKWFVVATLCFLIIRIHPDIGSAFIRTWSVDILFPVVLIATVILTGGLYQLENYKYFEVILALYILLFTGILFTESPAYYALNALRVLLVYVYVIFADTAIRGKRFTLDDTYFIFNLVLIFNVLVSLIQLLHIEPLFSVVDFMWASPKLRGIDSTTVRVTGTFMNANWFGVFFGAILPLYLQQLLQKRTSLSAILVLLVPLLVFLSGSRTGMVALITSVVVWAGLSRNLKTLSVASAITVSTISVPFFVLEISPLLYRFRAVYNIPLFDLMEGRINTMMVGAERFAQAPLFGHGYVDSIYHNSYVTMLNANGLFGLVIIVFLLVLIFSRQPNSLYRKVFLPASASLLVVSFTAEYLYVTQLTFPLAVVYSCCRHLSRK